MVSRIAIAIIALSLVSCSSVKNMFGNMNMGSGKLVSKVDLGENDPLTKKQRQQKIYLENFVASFQDAGLNVEAVYKGKPGSVNSWCSKHCKNGGNVEVLAYLNVEGMKVAMIAYGNSSGADAHYKVVMNSKGVKGRKPSSQEVESRKKYNFKNGRFYLQKMLQIGNSDPLDPKLVTAFKNHKPSARRKKKKWKGGFNRID